MLCRALRTHSVARTADGFSPRGRGWRSWNETNPSTSMVLNRDPEIKTSRVSPARRALPESRGLSTGSRHEAAAHLAGESARGRLIALLHVIHHHPIRIEAPSKCRDGALHAPNPGPGQAVMVPLVIEGNDLLFQSL